MENDMDLDLPLTMEFSDIISFSGLFCDSPTPPQDHETENPVSSQRPKEALDAEVITQPQRKGRNPKHNLSEKKRRDRIQAKLKLLREVIPNCQKLDSASLLDEAISHINALKCDLQMMQEMSQFPYTNVPPYNLQFSGTTPMPTFISQARSNIMIPGMNGNFTAMHRPLYVTFPPRFPAPVAGNVIQMPFLPPNSYCYEQLPGSSTAAMQPQMQAMPVHASYQKEMTKRTSNED